MDGDTHRRWERAFASVRNEWREAPWLVVLIVSVTAFVGPGLLWAAWRALSTLF